MQVDGRRRLSDEQRLNWLRLIRSENVGPATFRDLINHYGTAAAALEALPELAARGGLASRIRVASEADAHKELAAATRAGAAFVALGEPEYPPLLAALDHPPPLIAVRGNAAIAAARPVAIVGARNASVAGQKFAARLAAELGQAGHTIVSGLARGIDAAAHRASLPTGTVAVFAGGIDRVFPEEHAELAERIADSGGALVSEMPMGWQARAIDFPRRNRIIAGLAQGVVVVEAARRSGSLITARLANEAGRQVFAIPGSPLDPRAEGTNHLIRQGATLSTCAADVMEALAPLGAGQTPYEAGEGDELPTGESRSPASEDALARVRAVIVDALGPAPTEIDDIVRYCGASVPETLMVLLELDLAGRIERHPGNRVSLA
jgi:DNA processing protein